LICNKDRRNLPDPQPSIHMTQLAQNQLWKQGDRYFRIVIWERLAIRYKELDSPDNPEGTLHSVTKKEFCRLISGAELIKESEETPDI
jgi:hypothetical protein